jgi:hypothetical protein
MTKRLAALALLAATFLLVLAGPAAAAPCGTDCGTAPVEFKLHGTAAVTPSLLDGLKAEANRFLDFYLGPKVSATDAR